MVNVITGGELCLPLVQFLQYHKIKVSVYADATVRQDAMASLIHFCTQSSIPLTNDNPENIYDWLRRSGGKINFIIGYSHLLDTQRISSKQLLYTYNIHFGPLPEYRGANPVFWQIKNGVSELGITIHRINEKFDDGPVFWKKNIRREPYYSYGMANSILSNNLIEGAAYLIDSVLKQSVIPVIKPKEDAVRKYYPIPQLQDVLIDWQAMSVKEITNLILACNPWNKGAITLLNGREIKVLDAKEKEFENNGENPTGMILDTQGTLDVQCIGNKVLSITMVNIDGTFVPARDIAYYGLQKGMCFTSTFR